jgi:hypothetical protein
VPKYRIPFEWTVAGAVEVEAESLEEAADLVEEMDLDTLDASIVEDSFEVQIDFCSDEPGSMFGLIREEEVDE